MWNELQMYGIKTPWTYSFPSFLCHQSGTSWLFSVSWKPYIKAAASCLPMWKLHREKSDSQLTASWQTFFLGFYDRVYRVPCSYWPGTPLRFSFITWTPTQASQNMASCVFKVSKSFPQQKDPVDFLLSWLIETYTDNVPFDQRTQLHSQNRFTFINGI